MWHNPMEPICQLWGSHFASIARPFALLNREQNLELTYRGHIGHIIAFRQFLSKTAAAG